MIDAVVATNTIWKNQSDMTELPAATTSAAASAEPCRSARSASLGP